MPQQVPYPPSWVDRFQDWLYRLPFPIWLSIALIYLLSVLVFHVAIWIDGDLPIGTLDGESFFNGVWSILGLSFLLILNSTAKRSSEKFSVLVPRKKAELEAAEYQMTTIPALPALVLTGVIAVSLIAATYFDPTFVGLSNLFSLSLFLVIAIFSYSFAPIMLYQGFRQLVLVTKAYRLVSEINLFQLQPLYAFAGLTMTSSLLWVLVLNINIIGNTAETSTTDTVLALIFNTPFVALAFVTFIVPFGVFTGVSKIKKSGHWQKMVFRLSVRIKLSIATSIKVYKRQRYGEILGKPISHARTDRKGADLAVEPGDLS